MNNINISRLTIEQRNLLASLKIQQTSAGFVNTETNDVVDNRSIQAILDAYDAGASKFKKRPDQSLEDEFKASLEKSSTGQLFAPMSEEGRAQFKRDFSNKFESTGIGKILNRPLFTKKENAAENEERTDISKRPLTNDQLMFLKQKGFEPAKNSLGASFIRADTGRYAAKSSVDEALDEYLASKAKPAQANTKSDDCECESKDTSLSAEFSERFKTTGLGKIISKPLLSKKNNNTVTNDSAENVAILLAIDAKIVALGEIIAPGAIPKDGAPVVKREGPDKTGEEVKEVSTWIKVMRGVVGGIITLLTPLIKLFSGFVSTVWDVLKDAGKVVWNAISTFFTETIPSFFSSDFVDAVIDTIKNIMTGVGEFLASSFTGIFEASGDIFESIKSKITNFIKLGVDTIEDSAKKPSDLKPPPAPGPTPKAPSAPKVTTRPPAVAAPVPRVSPKPSPVAIPEQKTTPTSTIEAKPVIPKMLGESSTGWDDVKAMVIKHEGKRNKPYKDSLGLWTVGIGHLIGDGKSLPAEWNREFSDAEVMALFDKDFEHHKKIAEKTPGYDKANRGGKAAFIDLAFNMGMWWPKWKNTRAKLEKGDFRGAAEGLKDSLWYKQVKGRAKTIVALVEQAGSPISDAGIQPITPTATSGTQVASATQAADIRPPSAAKVALSVEQAKQKPVSQVPSKATTVASSGTDPTGGYKSYYGVA